MDKLQVAEDEKIFTEKLKKQVKRASFVNTVSSYIQNIGPIICPKPKTPEGWELLKAVCGVSREYMEHGEDVIVQQKARYPVSEEVNFDAMTHRL